MFLESHLTYTRYITLVEKLTHHISINSLSQKTNVPKYLFEKILQ